MSIWKLTYFELNYTSAYKSEIYYGIDARNAALALFFRLGGDDVVQVTALNLNILVQRFDGLNHIRLLRRVCMTRCG